MSTISNTHYGTVVLGGAAYPSPLTVEASGSIIGSINDGPAGTGVYSNTAGVSLTNQGHISAYSGTFGYGYAGVDLAAGGTVTNSGGIAGGVGDYHGQAGGAGVFLNGGVLVNASTGSISGGDGGYGHFGSGGSGGTGVDLTAAGMVTNNGAISGGAGGSTGPGAGGAGIVLAAGSSLTNTGVIHGGTGDQNYGSFYTGKDGPGVGGAGVVATSSSVTNTGHITGGNGGAATPFGPGGTGGAGVFLNGGTLTTSGTISGGQGGAAYQNYAAGAAGDAVQFGTLASTLVVKPGAVFNGQVAANASVNDVLRLSGVQSGGTPITLGTQFTNFSTLAFASGAAWTVDVGTGAAPSGGLAVNTFTTSDTIDVTNLTPTQVAGDFNPSTDKLTTAGDGTLHFTGSFSGEYFLFSNDGSGGTDITLVHGAGISTTVTSTVTVGSTAHPTPLTITSTGVVAPTRAGATGVLSNASNNSLTNNGAIQGGSGSTGSAGSNSAGGTGGSGGVAGRGGVGVNQSAGALTNSHQITGGVGGTGGIGGNGQNGGAGGAGGIGGIGLTLSGGMVTNNSGGSIAGGAGGAGGNGGTGGQNGNGGIGAVGGHGGVGVALSSSGTLTNAGSITGGSGGTGGQDGSPFAHSINGSGAGGVGVTASGGSLTNDSGGSITGGAGVYGIFVCGAGAAGVTLSGGTLTNNSGASITGGASGGCLDANGAVGGAGVVVSAAMLTNAGTISGGSGSHAQAFGSSVVGGAGGAGVSLNGGTLINSGTISGGAGGTGTTAGAAGGAGVVLNGGTLTTSGTISGGAGGIKTTTGPAGDAVKFGTAASTLVVDPGAVFNDKVVANASVHDVLELSGTQSGGTAITLGTEFTNFSTLDFAAGAAWTADANIADLTSHPLSIDGFGMSDTLDITNLGHTGATASFDTTHDVLTITKGATTLHLQFDSAFSGDDFVLTANGAGTDVTLQAAPAATLATAAHDLMNFVGDEHRALTDDRSMFSTHGAGSGSMLHTDPTLLALGGHGFSANALTDHSLAHASVVLW